MTRDTKAEARAINTILWTDWDPIGCGVPEDEYESYVWPVYKLLIDGKGAGEVADYLRWVCRTQIELTPNEDRISVAVAKLTSLRLAQTEEKYR